VGHLDETASEPDQVVEPERFESDLGTQPLKLGRYFVVHVDFAGDDRHRHIAMSGVCPQPAEETDAVYNRHAQIQKNRIGLALGGLREPHFRIQGGADVETFEPEHAGKRVRDSFVVVDDENRSRGPLRGSCHAVILTDAVTYGRRTAPMTALELDKLMLHLGVFGDAAVSPILVRPVREQLEHDRIIRLLQAKGRRRFEVAMNPGAEQNAAVGSGASAVYPDLVLLSPERGRRLMAVVEVETGESVNHLEALAQWTHYAKLRAAFHLYVPSAMVDVARRLIEENHVQVTELWSYHTVAEDVRFTLVHRDREPIPSPRAAAARRPKPRVTAAKRPVRKKPVARATAKKAKRK
jgi:hypothetical protein